MATLVSYALTSLSDVKESLGISSGNTAKDNLIKRKINAGTDIIERYCQLDEIHHFKKATYTDEEYDGTGIDQLILRMRPVIISGSDTFTLYLRNGSLNEDNWETIDDSEYFVDKRAGVIDAKFTFIKQYNRYKVTYNAGYEDIPNDLQEACAVLAGYLVNNASEGTGVKRKKEGQREIEYFQASSSSDKSLLQQLNLDEILDPYARISLIDNV